VYSTLCLVKSLPWQGLSAFWAAAADEERQFDAAAHISHLLLLSWLWLDLRCQLLKVCSKRCIQSSRESGQSDM
jgi:hypothetical protein